MKSQIFSSLRDHNKLSGEGKGKTEKVEFVLGINRSTQHVQPPPPPPLDGGSSDTKSNGVSWIVNSFSALTKQMVGLAFMRLLRILAHRHVGKHVNEVSTFSTSE
jgi:hypothetical protein